MNGERTYRLLLRAYPESFREAYEREMLLAFRAHARASGRLGARGWMELLWDVARSAPGLRADAWRARWDAHLHLRGTTMKAFAISTVVIGALELLGGFAEGWAGGIGRHDGVSLAAGALAIVAGAALIVAGVALLRHAWHAGVRAAVPAAICLGAFVIAALATPRMSIASTLLGIVFPLAVLLVLTTGRARGTPVGA